MLKSFRFKGPADAAYVRDPETREYVLVKKGKAIETESLAFQKALLENADFEEVKEKSEAKPDKAPSRKNGES